MTAVENRPKSQQRAASRGRHPASRVKADGRGPRRFSGRRTPLFLILLVAVSSLVLLGVVMVLSASAVVSINNSSSAWSLFRRHLLSVGIGTVAMLIMTCVDYHRLRIFAAPVMIGASLGLVAVLIPGVGVSTNGATRWLDVGPLSVQPSEFMKLALVLFIADLLSRPSRPMLETHITVRPVVVVTGLVVGLLVMQPHLGAILVIGLIAGTMMFLAGAPIRQLFGLGSIGAAVTSFMVLATPWRRARFLAFRDPWAEPVFGYQSLQSLHAITVGGISGVGLGGSRAKWGFLPYAHTDFLFAIIAEELGLLGAATVLLVFAVIGVAGMVTALRAPDRFGMLLALGITIMIVAQAVLNLGAVLSLLPVMGVTLPFLSFGGSSLVVSLTGVGVLLNVARQGR